MYSGASFSDENRGPMKGKASLDIWVLLQRMARGALSSTARAATAPALWLVGTDTCRMGVLRTRSCRLRMGSITARLFLYLLHVEMIIFGYIV